MMPSVKKESKSKVGGLSKREIKKKINIRWNSGLFFQIGLIISMLLVFLVVESNIGFSEMTFAIPERKELNEVALQNYVVQVIPEKKIEVKEIVKERKPIKPIVSNKFKPVKNTTLEKESKTIPTEVDPNATIEKPKTVIRETKPIGKKNVMSVQNVPIFPGCEYLLTNEERKTCLNERVNAFINRKFDIDKFSDKYAGENNRIDVQFTVDSNGAIVDIKTRTPHKDLSVEAKRVVGKLPKMIPGKHNDQLVDVVYTVPIMLNIKY